MLDMLCTENTEAFYALIQLCEAKKENMKKGTLRLCITKYVKVKALRIITYMEVKQTVLFFLKYITYKSHYKWTNLCETFRLDRVKFLNFLGVWCKKNEKFRE